MSRLNSIISWVGGKKALRDLIYTRFPKKYGRYIEIFGGGGWVLFGKKIDKYDRPDAFFYCDPPYYETEGHYAVVFTKEDHTRLRNVLENIQGKFLLSYNDCEFIRELYKEFYIESCTRTNNMALRYDNEAQFPEVLISNYNPMEGVSIQKQLGLFDKESEDM